MPSETTNARNKFSFYGTHNLLIAVGSQMSLTSEKLHKTKYEVKWRLDKYHRLKIMIDKFRLEESGEVKLAAINRPLDSHHCRCRSLRLLCQYKIFPAI